MDSAVVEYLASSLVFRGTPICLLTIGRQDAILLSHIFALVIRRNDAAPHEEDPNQRKGLFCGIRSIWPAHVQHVRFGL